MSEGSPGPVPDVWRQRGELDRRSLLRWAAAMVIGVSPLAGLVVACGTGDRRGAMMPDSESAMWMMSRGMDAQMMRDMPVIHNLLLTHDVIRRQVTDVAGGIHAVTTSADPGVAQLIRTHVWGMKERVEQGRPIRQMDPLFREIFEHHQLLDLRVENVPGGVRAIETSDDPQVAMLIRQHARRAVSEFVRFGMQRAMQPTPLPEGYRG
jgi:hypothetical protein